MPVKKGDKVKVEYTGTLEDGTVFDSSERHGQPLEFQIGAGQVIKGFENAFIGMEIGQEKEIKLKPEEAYGNRNPQLVKEIPKNQLPHGQEVKEGMVLVLALPNGQQIPAKITKMTNELIIIDLNHPLADKTLIFKVKVVEIIT